MSATSQHGFHPDTESLSAFAEQALSERERAEVFSHLAVCGRCRQVVALAREAGDADAGEASTTPRKIVASDVWWRQWRLVWIPTAIVTAFAAVSISVYIGQADRHGPDAKDAKIATQTATHDAAPPSTPSPSEQAQVEPDASPARTPPPTHTAKRAHAAAPEPLPAPAPSAVAAQTPPEPGVPDRGEAKRNTPSRPEAYEQPAPPKVIGGAMRPSFSQPAAGVWDGKQKPAEEQRQAQVNASRMRSFTASPATANPATANPAPAAVHGSNGATPAGATQTVTVAAAPQLETAPMETPQIDTAGNGPMQPTPRLGIQSAWKASTPVKQIQLPSGLAVISSTSTGPIVLAIDKAGSLFLSSDQGDTWQRAKKRWKGRAVQITQQFTTNAEAQSAPTDETETAPSTPGNAGAAPSVIFELLNDKGQAWVSTDGRTWTPK